MKLNKNNKGFTLIELLAVIVIMGILMLVAVPAMSKIIENSKKDTFIETAQTYTNAVNTLWKSDNLFCGSVGNTPSNLTTGNYYVLIDSSNDELLERGGKSSWGNKDVKGYVRVKVVFDELGKKYESFHVALSDGVHGIKEVNENVNELTRKDVLLDLEDEQDYFIPSKINSCVLDGNGYDQPPLKMEKGTKEEPKINDMFTIGTERFHIISSDSTTVTGLAEYNVYAGGVHTDKWREYGKEATFLQDYRMIGRNHKKAKGTGKGTLSFSHHSNQYNDSIIKPYVDKYEEKLEGFGVNVIESRLLTGDEYREIYKCKDCRDWLFKTTYWTNEIVGPRHLTAVYMNGFSGMLGYGYSSYAGIRPVITVSKADLV